VYSMKDIVSTLFRVISFPHDGIIRAIDELLFIVPNFITNPMTSLNNSYMKIVSPPSRVNYVVLSPMSSVAYEDKPLTVKSSYYELSLVFDMVNSSIGILEPCLLTLVVAIDMCSFQSLLLPSSEYLLESMTEFCPLTWFPFGSSSSWKS
jgi:hypothetical protein